MKQIFEQGKKSGCLGFIGDYTTQLFGDYNTVNHYISFPDFYSATSISWKVTGLGGLKFHFGGLKFHLGGLKFHFIG